jgi:chloramphenicol 3-O-phosphotransferase
MIAGVKSQLIHIKGGIMSYIKQTGDVIVSSGADTQNLLADEVQRSAGVTAVMMIKNDQQDEKAQEAEGSKRPGQHPEIARSPARNRQTSVTAGANASSS